MADVDALFDDPPAAAPEVVVVEVPTLVPRWRENDVIVRAVGLVRIAADLLGVFRSLRDADDRVLKAFPAVVTDDDVARWWPLHNRERSLFIKLAPNLAVLGTCPWAAHRLRVRQPTRGGFCELMAWHETVVQPFVAEVVGNENPFAFATRFTEYAALAHWIEQAQAAANPRADPPRGPVIFIPLDSAFIPNVETTKKQKKPKKTKGKQPAPASDDEDAAVAATAGSNTQGRVQACTLAELLGGDSYVDTTTIGRDELVGLIFESVEAYLSARTAEDVAHLRPPLTMAEKDGVPDYAESRTPTQFFRAVNDVSPIPLGLGLLRYRLDALLPLQLMFSRGPELQQLLQSTEAAASLVDLPDMDIVRLANLLDLDLLAPSPELMDSDHDAMDLDEPDGPSIPAAVQELLEAPTTAVVRKLIFGAEGTPHPWVQYLMTRTTTEQVVTLLHALVMRSRLSMHLELSSPAARVLIRRRDIEYQLKWLPATSGKPNVDDLDQYLRVQRRRDDPIPAAFYSAPVESAALLLNHEPLTMMKDRVKRLQRLVFEQLGARIIVTSLEDQLDWPLGGALDTTEQWLNEHRSMSIVIVPAAYAVALPPRRQALTLGPNGTLGLFVTDREYVAAVAQVNSEESARALLTQSLHMRITDAHVYPIGRLQQLLEARVRLGPVATDGSIEIHGCVELLGLVPDLVRPFTPVLLALRHLADSSARVPTTDELVGQAQLAVLVGKLPKWAHVSNEELGAEKMITQTWLVAEAFQLSNSIMYKYRPHQVVRLTQPLLGLAEGKLHMEYNQFRYWLTVDELATLCYLTRHAQPSITLVVHAKASDLAAGAPINLIDEYCKLASNTPIPRHRLTNYWTTADV